jgi:hypothetical protein
MLGAYGLLTTAMRNAQLRREDLEGVGG